MEPVAITLDPMTEGDSWDGIPVIAPTFGHWTDPVAKTGWVDDNPPGTLVKARLFFRREGFKDVQLHCESVTFGESRDEIDQPIIIDHNGTNSPPTWALHIDPMGFDSFPLTAGTWTGDFEFIFGDGSQKKTYYRITQVVNPQGTV